MDTQKIDLENLTQDDFLEMAKYVAYMENQNNILVEQLREAKAMLTATVQQRNSLNIRLQQLINEKANTIDIKQVQNAEIVTNVDLTNPEMYRVPSHRLGLGEKADRI